MPSKRWKTLKGKLLTRTTLIDSFRQKGVISVFNDDGELNAELKLNEQEVKKQLQELREAYQEFAKYYSMLEMFQQFENQEGLEYSEQSNLFKSITQVLINEKSASNLATQLLGTDIGLDITHIAQGYDAAYQKFFNAYAKSISLLEEANYSLRGQTNLHHIGILDDKFLKEFSLDENSMKQFRENGEMFKIVMSRSATTGLLNASFRTRETLRSSTVIDELRSITKSKVTQSRLGVGELQPTTLVGRLFNAFREKELYDPITKNIDDNSGRYYEAFDEYLIKNYMDSNGVLSHKSLLSSLLHLPDKITHIMDNLPWVSGGDNVINNYTISNKFFNFSSKNAKIGKGGFNLSNLTTIFDSFDVLLRPDMLLKKYNSYSEQQINAMTEDQLFSELEQWGYLGQDSVNAALVGGAFNDSLDGFGKDIASEINAIMAYYGGSCDYG